MLRALKKLFAKIFIGSGRKINHTKKEAKDYIDSFPDPKDDLERSWFQYKCQAWDSYGRVQIMIANLASFVLYLPFYFKYRAKAKEPVRQEKSRCVAAEELILPSIPIEYRDDCIIPNSYIGRLDRKDTQFLRTITKRYPFAFYFRFKIMGRIANYSYIISKHSPEIIFCSAEYSYTSSVLTHYCEKREISLCNAMHGEKGFDIRDAFCRFSKFYVWDEFYKNLFLELRASKTEYIIRQLEVPMIETIQNINHYTYYLQEQKAKQMMIIKKKFESMNVDYIVRPHPIYSGDDVYKVFDSNHIEKNIDIWESIKRAGNVVSVDSTVNYQAFLAGVRVVLDDISEPEYFSKLEEREYIMLSKPHKLLSKI